MRMHVFAIALVGTSAIAAVTSCGESLPSPDEPVDASTDGSSDDAAGDVVPEVGLADAGCATLTAPCNAEEIAAASASAIAASASALVWLEGDTVFALNPNGLPIAVMKPISGGASTGFLAISGVTALMTQGSGVNRCRTDAPCLADGGPSIGAPIFSLVDTGPVAADNADIFVAERGGQRRLALCGLAQSCNDNPQVVAYLPFAATRLVLTTAFVLLGFTDKTLRAYPRSDRQDAGVAAPAPFATAADLRGLAASGLSVYWTDGAGGTITRCDVATCAASTQVLLTNRAFPRSIALSNGKAYWVETDADAVLRCTLPACSDATVIAKVARPNDLAVGDRIYVTTEMQRIYAIAP